MKSKDVKKFMRWTIGFTLGLNLLFIIKDISDDVREGAGFWHIGPEIAIVVGTVATAVLALVHLMRMKVHTDQLRSQVAELEVANRDWQERTRSYAYGLSAEIDAQLATWGLSQAEKEIALLLMKGLSNKEIAEIRETSEHTIKQQSSAVYKKSGLGSRSSLSAFFLEDLLSPRQKLSQLTGDYGAVPSTPPSSLSH